MLITIFVFTFNLLIPVIMLIMGLAFRKPPKKINYIYGYRTTRSMQNQDTWEFAHVYFGSIMRKVSIITIIISLIASIISMNFNDDMKAIIMLIVITVQTIVIIAAIFPVEKALKQTFDEKGNRRV